MNWKAVSGGLALVILIAVLIFSLSGTENPSTGEQTNPQPIPPNLQQMEAPMLAALVASGELPPVEERLPKNPAVVVPVDKPGRYGGVWRRYAIDSDSPGMSRIIYDPALRWSADGMEIKPNLCWKREVSDDYRIFTFWLREGVRWSDGHPMTTEDVRFWWEDYILDKELNPLTPTWVRIGEDLPVFEVLGPYSFRFVFPRPYGLFLERVAWRGNMWMPKHYLKQFHRNYRPEEELRAEAAAAGFSFWYQLFSDKLLWESNPEVPMITAWVIKNSWSSPHRVFERNPYYWKVDNEGRQLPYIDRVTHDAIQARGTLLFNLMNGDVLLQARHVGLKDIPLFEEAVRRGKVEIYNWIPASNQGLSIMINQTYTGDDVFARELLREKKVRWALSYAIPREEISELFYYGLGTPRQPAPIEQSPYYDYGRRFAETALEYNPEKANRLIDELGLTKRNANGYRLRPDGKPIALTVDHGASTEGAQLAEYFSRRCLAPLGIRGILKPNTGRRVWAGMPMLYLGSGIGRNHQLLIQPIWYIPYNHHPYWAIQYGLWYKTNGAQGWQPPEEILRIQEIYGEIKASGDKFRRYELMGQILDIHAENLWLIGALGGIPSPVIVSPRAGNVPREIISSWLFMTPGNAHPEQFYAKW